MEAACRLHWGRNWMAGGQQHTWGKTCLLISHFWPRLHYTGGQQHTCDKTCLLISYFGLVYENWIAFMPSQNHSWYRIFMNINPWLIVFKVIYGLISGEELHSGGGGGRMEDGVLVFWGNFVFQTCFGLWLNIWKSTLKNALPRNCRITDCHSSIKQI